MRDSGVLRGARFLRPLLSYLRVATPRPAVTLQDMENMNYFTQVGFGLEKWKQKVKTQNSNT